MSAPPPRRKKPRQTQTNMPPEWVSRGLDVYGYIFGALGIPLALLGAIVGVVGGRIGQAAAVVGAIVGGGSSSGDWLLMAVAGFLVLLAGTALLYLGVVILGREHLYRERRGILPGCLVLGGFLYVLTRLVGVALLSEEYSLRATSVALVLVVVLFGPAAVLSLWEAVATYSPTSLRTGRKPSQ